MSSEDDEKGMSGSDLARKVWLAGLGAYGKAINTSQGAAMKLGSDANKVFEELVSRGEKLEDAVEEVVEDAVESTREGTRQAKASVEDRISKLKSQFGLTEEPEDNRMDVMEDRMERLEAKIDALLAALDDKPKPKRKRTTRARKSD